MKMRTVRKKNKKITEKKFCRFKIFWMNYKKSKDHNENGHTDSVYFSSILRAKNYNIKSGKRNKTKIISGKIIPTY